MVFMFVEGRTQPRSLYHTTLAAMSTTTSMCLVLRLFQYVRTMSSVYLLP